MEAHFFQHQDKRSTTNSNAMNPDHTPPCYGQTAEEVEAWLRANVRIGATVAIRHTQGGLLQYATATVTRIGKGRFEVDTLGPGNLSTAGLTFYYSGKNCWSPKGQTRLVIPTEAVLAARGQPGDQGIVHIKTTV